MRFESECEKCYLRMLATWCVGAAGVISTISAITCRASRAEIEKINKEVEEQVEKIRNWEIPSIFSRIGNEELVELEIAKENEDWVEARVRK